MSDGHAGAPKTRRRLCRDDYIVGWICAHPWELAAAEAMLDDEHEQLERVNGDDNLYTFGQIGKHNTVIACLPAGIAGASSAATVATQMRLIFRSLQFGLMVGIGSGVPGPEADIRLGDVVVSQPSSSHGGVLQFDFDPSGYTKRTGHLNMPPNMLLAALNRLHANLLLSDKALLGYCSKFQNRRGILFARENAGADILYDAAYSHIPGPTCHSCTIERQVKRDPRRTSDPLVHYGTIASGNQEIRDAVRRDAVSKKLGGVLCFEREAAGVMNTFPCLVIRGISDYADSHKYEKWRAYAAGTAAVCAREVLSVITPIEYRTLVLISRSDGIADRFQLDTHKSSYYIPFLPNKQFVGRNAELEKLTRKLFDNQECQKVALIGLGGAGKTQIALEFAYRVKAARPEYSIFWLPAVSMETFEQACREVASELGISPAADDKEDVREVVRRFLSKKEVGPWLLIVDNADDVELVVGDGGINEHLPQSEDGLIVYTTRTREAAQALAPGNFINVKEMSEAEALDFLGKALADEREELLDDRSIVIELLDELTYLPLAILQAAAFLNLNVQLSIKGYMDLLKSTERVATKLLSEEFAIEQRYKGSKNAVVSTWLVSFKQITERSPAAIDLLAFMSCIESKAIPRSILPTIGDEIDTEKAIGVLTGYAFISTRKDREMYDLHRLVHLAAGNWLRTQGLIAEKTREAIHHIASVFHTDDWDHRDVWRAYLPHAVKVLGSSEGKELAERYHICYWIGRCLLVDFRGTDAEVWLEKSATGRRDILFLPEDHIDRLESQN
ncbi:hypothetical protein HDU93_004046 [Gonapodya sp. JEL0774]|nr:hypothetical protein HDU93_004046 [Gonapodya sp. JEL0774]